DAVSKAGRPLGRPAGTQTLVGAGLVRDELAIASPCRGSVAAASAVYSAARRIGTRHVWCSRRCLGDGSLRRPASSWRSTSFGRFVLGAWLRAGTATGGHGLSHARLSRPVCSVGLHRRSGDATGVVLGAGDVAGPSHSVRSASQKRRCARRFCEASLTKRVTPHA